MRGAHDVSELWYNSRVKKKLIALSVLSAALAPCAFALGEHPAPGVGAGPQTGVRYATDAYPGFDNEKDMVSPERKQPRWFSFITGPDRESAAEQFEYCRGLMAEERWSKARRQLDALVREWPTSPEAPRAQHAIAEICLDRLGSAEDAFAEYRYLLDFYSLSCDYDKIADRLYQVANLMKSEGKEVCFIRFANTVDVRRAYEACVLRAPGASWAPEAMLTIGALREDEGKYGEAVKVYENLRNIHPGSDEAKSALLREAEARMVLLRDHAYNRSRCRDTVDFLRQSLKGCRESDMARIQECLAEASGLIAEEEWRATTFYDSPTRTRRSAVSAYEKYLAEHPDSVHAAEARARLEELKGDVK